MASYYKADNRGLTLRELWNICPSWKILIPWIAGRLQIPLDMGSGILEPESAREIEVPENAFPAEARAALQPLIDGCLALGFHSPRFYSIENLRRDVQVSFVQLLHSSGEIAGRLMFSVGRMAVPPIQSKLISLMSELSDDTWLFTTDDKPKYRQTPRATTQRIIGGSPAQLLALHQQKLTELRWQKPPKPIGSMEALEDSWDSHERYWLEVNLSRRSFRRMSPEEAEQERNIVARATAAAASPAGSEHEHTDVLAEIARLQNKKSGWAGALILLFVSLILFTGLGSWRWSWDFVVILLPVLFFHELGHYIAMRYFRYRNVRMFFIPLFGAAVFGRHYNVPGWKKVIVSLMGPVPGIVVGAVLAVVGLSLDDSLLTRIALITLLLNGSNLLPFLPLDGGWVFHNLLFSRHYLLDTAFRALAAVALLAAGFFLDSTVLLILGGLMLFAVPAVYRTTRLVAKLRASGIPRMSDDAETIPPETARTIITEVTGTMPKHHFKTHVAQQTLTVFEALNARPPGWIGTIALFLVYGASVAVAVVFSLLIVAGGWNFFPRTFAAAPEITYPLACGPLPTWRGDAATNDANISIVGTFSDAADAATVFANLTNQLPANAILKQFGHSLFLSLPESAAETTNHWLAGMNETAETAFIDFTNSWTTLTLSCTAPDDETAARIAAELERYFHTPCTSLLIPPWVPDDPRSAEEQSRHELARMTYRKVLSIPSTLPDDPEYQKLSRRLQSSSRRDRIDPENANSLINEMLAVSQQHTKQRLEEMRRSAAGTVDVPLINLYETFQAKLAAADAGGDGVDPGRFHLELAERMGSIPATDAAIRRISSWSGTVNHDGDQLTLAWVQFSHLADGVPALVDWLCNSGCANLKYTIRNRSDSHDED